MKIVILTAKNKNLRLRRTKSILNRGASNQFDAFNQEHNQQKLRKYTVNIILPW